MPRKHDAYKHMIASLLETAADTDNRLSYGQLHAVVVDAMGGEPLVIASAIHSRLSDHRSKLNCAPQYLAELAIKIHDRLYAQPDFRTRKRSEEENEFQLSFAWQEPERARSDV